ncbi:PE-PGRS family protein [Sorangium sp. So ce124]|uniref:PE-PGRS family protein n=1 Tax=Sorangium sp. So ce124 TaxID=3133280 RepID=UPI003F6313DD
MLSQKTALQLVLCLTIGFSAAACSDDGGETGNSTSTSTSTSTGSSSTSSSSGQGGGTGGTDGQGGAGGADVGTGGQGGGTGGADVGTGGQGGGTGGAGAGEGGSATPGDPACGADTATFADVRPILQTNCAGCHGNNGPASGGLDLRANAAHDGLVEHDSATCDGRVLVVPGKPSESYIINLLHGQNLCAEGKRMPPPPNQALSAANIKKINDWICAGAPE